MATDTWPGPAAVLSVIVETGGGGGIGGPGAGEGFGSGAPGGGGGAYSRRKVPVVPTTPYPVAWQAVGEENIHTTFSSGGTEVKAGAGVGGPFGGAGADAAGGVGDVKFSGGNSYFPPYDTSLTGGGGGGAAGRAGDGASAGGQGGGIGADTPDGDGGAGGANLTAGDAAPSGRGGGGGGGGRSAGGPGGPGGGMSSSGWIIIYDDTDNTGFNPNKPRIGVFGNPPPQVENPKARKTMCVL